MPQEKTKKTVVFTGYRCNNHCKFCMEEEKRDLLPRGTKEIKKEIVGAKNRGTDYLELIGGEMTIRSDFIELIKFADSLDFSTIMIATNGRMFSYKDYAREILEAGLTDLVFSIHGHKPELHDSLTQVPGSFAELTEGIRNARQISDNLDLGINFGANVTIVKPNYKHLSEIGKLIKDFGIRNSEFIFVDCNEGGAYKRFDKLVPRISEAAPYIKDCLDIGPGFTHWHVRYVPLCYFEGYLDQISEIQEVLTFKTEHVAQDFENYNAEEGRKEEGRVKTEKCEDCALNSYCEGIWKEYYNHFGDEEFRPVGKLTPRHKKLIESVV